MTQKKPIITECVENGRWCLNLDFGQDQDAMRSFSDKLRAEPELPADVVEAMFLGIMNATDRQLAIPLSDWSGRNLLRRRLKAALSAIGSFIQARIQAEREDCARKAYVACAKTKHVTLGDKVHSAILKGSDNA